MDNYTRESLEEALQVVSSIICQCEKMQLKFAAGTSAHTLLKNRIKAMYLSKSLITGDNVQDQYTKDELIEALRPVSSVIRKCEKAQLKSAAGTPSHTRLKNLLNAMSISQSLILEELSRRE